MKPKLSKAVRDTQTPQRVIVTGGNGGIGGAIVARYRAAGAAVISMDVAGDAPDGATFIPANIASEADVERAFDAVDAHWQGRAPDVFIACAAVSKPGHLLEMAVADFDAMVAINIRGTFLTTRAAAKRMAAAKTGAIVMISSVSAQQAWAHEAGYSATKAATSSLCQGFAIDLAPFNIRVNAVAPGPIEHRAQSMATTRTDPDVYRHEIERTPMGRLGTPEEVADSVFMISNAPWVTGQVLAIDGGFMASGLGYFGKARDTLVSSLGE